MNFIPDMKLDLSPLVQCLADIISSTHKGVAKLLDLCIGKALAGVIRDRLLQDAQNRSDAQSVDCGTKRYEDGALMDVAGNYSGNQIVELLGREMHKGELANFVKALEATTKILEMIPIKMVSEEPTQKTFFNRWRKEVELVDDEQLRSLWAKILAQEIVRPGAISLRTLDVVRNLSTAEARLFQQMVRGEIDGMIPVDNNGHPQYVQYTDALALQDAGLIFAQQSRRTFGLGYNIEGERKGTAIPLQRCGLVACIHDASEYSTQCYILTDAGRCLLPIAQDKRELKNYIEVFNWMPGKDSKLVVSLHAVQSCTGNETTWNTIPLWTRAVEESEKAGSAKGETK